MRDGWGSLRWWEWVLLGVGLLLFVGQAALSSPQKSAAFDEQYHVAAGYAYLKTADFRMSLSHPPLINALSALPLLWRDDVGLPLEHPSWAAGDYFSFADVFMWQAQPDPQGVLVWARWPVIALGAMLAAALFVWARQMAGPWAGWLALTLAVFDPNLLANSRLVTTDLGLSCFLLLTMWRLWCWLERPSRINLLLTGVLAGCTMAAKFTGLLVWPMIGLVVLLWRWAEADWVWNGRNLGKLVGQMAVMGLCGFMALWAVFRFDISPYPGTNIPLPASFYPYSLWDTFVGIEQQPKTSFLLGQTSPRGWWYYFPVALVVKTSLPTLILTAVGLWALVQSTGWRRSAVVWLPPLAFMLLAMSGRITIGYRHILPMVPFLILLAAQMGRLLGVDYPRLQRPLLAGGVAALLLWQAVAVVRLFPHQEAYFNELAGGPAGGGRILVDSNVDWGQDLIALREWMAEQGVEQVKLGYFGTAVPEAYGVNYEPIPGFLRQTAGPEVNAYNPYTPPPGWYAISQTSLQLGLLEQNVEMYAYFREQEPVARAGYSINLYEVADAPETAVDRVVVVGSAVSDVDAVQLGVVNGRRLVTKWTANEATQIVPLDQPWTPPEGFVAVDANFADVLTLRGYVVGQTAVAPGEPVHLTLFWQRGSAAVPQPAPTKGSPLAAFVHFSGADPAQIVTQFDGWDTAVATLEPGDLIIQQITLWPPAETPPGVYWLRTGLYSPQTNGRFALVGGGDVVTLGEVLVE
jgi:hypothetical protein